MSFGNMLRYAGLKFNSDGNTILNKLLRSNTDANSGEAPKGVKLHTFNEVQANDAVGIDIPIGASTAAFIFVGAQESGNAGVFYRQEGNAVTLISANTANVDDANTDAALCCYNASGNLRARNRLGSEQTINIFCIEFPAIT